MSIRKLVCLATTLTLALAAGEAPAQGQTTPTVFTFCYMPSVGAVYRIKTADTHDSCRSPRHVEFSWTDGLPGRDHGALNGLSDDDHPEYVREGESAAGDLSGAYPRPTVHALQGHGVAAVAPTEGQVLAFSSGAWTPTTPASSGMSFADLLSVDGTGSGLDADLLDGQDGSAFASATHNHDAAYAAIAHTHDNRYYTETESDARYMREGEPAAGDLTGTYPAPTVAGLQGNPVSGTAPIDGQLLGWDGTAWAPISPSSGGVSDHGALTGLTDDDHGQYLLTDGARASYAGVAVTGERRGFDLVPPATGAGVRMMWYPAKAAFRAGEATAGSWEDGEIGDWSAAVGYGTLASGAYAFAAGKGTRANAYSASFGEGTFSRDHSASFGVGTQTGDYSGAFGEDTKARSWSFATGLRSMAMGNRSTALGHEAVATGDFSLAAGYLTTANARWSTALGKSASTNSHTGAFVYGDASTSSILNAPANHSFTVRASGGTAFYSSSDLSAGVTLSAGGGSWATVSDRHRKENFEDVDGEVVLSRIAAIPIQSWSYRTQDPSIRHIGPTAQEFHAAFGLGDSNLTITSSDISGVNMLAVQALEQRTRELQAENEELRRLLSRLEARLASVGRQPN